MLITWLTAANSCAVGLVTLTVESDDRKRLAATKVCYINVQPQGIFFFLLMLVAHAYSWLCVASCFAYPV